MILLKSTQRFSFFVCLFFLFDEGYYLFFGAVSQVSLAGLEVTAEVAWTPHLPVHTASGLALQHALPLLRFYNARIEPRASCTWVKPSMIQL